MLEKLVSLLLEGFHQVRGFWHLVLFKCGLKEFEVADIYTSFVNGSLSKDDVSDFLRPAQFAAFIDLHERMRPVMDDSNSALAQLPIEMLPYHADLPRSEARLACAVRQLDCFIAQELAERIEPRSDLLGGGARG